MTDLPPAGDGKDARLGLYGRRRRRDPVDEAGIIRPAGTDDITGRSRRCGILLSWHDVSTLLLSRQFMS